MNDQCTNCDATAGGCETKRWLSGRPCCDGCTHTTVRGLGRTEYGLTHTLAPPPPRDDWTLTRGPGVSTGMHPRSHHPMNRAFGLRACLPQNGVNE